MLSAFSPFDAYNEEYSTVLQGVLEILACSVDVPILISPLEV